MSAGGSNAGKEGASEAVGVKEINQQVKNMMETTRRNLLELQQTKRKMQGIKQAYQLLFSDRYSKAIEQAFDHKLAVLEKIVAKQEESIQLLKSERGVTNQNRIKIKLQDLKTKADAAFQKDALLHGLVMLEQTLEKLDERKEEVLKRVDAVRGSGQYDFANI